MNPIPAAIAAALLCARGACADPVFIDEFDGTELKPWWELGNPPMQYTVGGGLLTVTKVVQQIGDDLYANAMGASPDPFAGDFDATCRMGWSPGTHRVLEFMAITGPYLLAKWGYKEVNVPQPKVYAWTGLGGGEYFPAPEPGLHEFRFVREGDSFRFSLDGELLLELPDLQGTPIDQIVVWFAGPKTNMAPMYVDSVHVVPAPGSLAVVLAAAGGASRRRRATS